jgi:hypothetical protein
VSRPADITHALQGFAVRSEQDDDEVDLAALVRRVDESSAQSDVEHRSTDGDDGGAPGRGAP